MKKIEALELNIDLTKSIRSYQDFIDLQSRVKQQILDIREANKDLRKELKRINSDETIDLNTRRELRGKLIKEITANERALKDLGKESRRLNKSFDSIDDTKGAFERLRAELRQVKNEMKDLKAEGKSVPAELQSKFDDLNGRFKSINDTVEDFHYNVGNYKSAFSDFGDTLRGNLGEILTGPGGIRAGLQGVVTDLGKFAAGGGLIAAGVVAATLLGKVVFETTEEFVRMRNVVATTTTAIGEDIDTLTIGAAAISRTFNVEFDDVTRSANVLTNELTGNFSESIDLIRRAGLALGPAFQEGLDQIAEYSTQARESGIATEEFLEIIIRAQKEGIYSDKGIDSIKEAGIRIREQTKSTTDAIANAFGSEFADRIFSGINDGSLTTIEALKEISGEIENFEGPVNELQTVIADLFAGAGEDAGRRFLELIGDLDGDIDSLINTTDELTLRNLRLYSANERLATAQNEIAKAFGNTASSAAVFGAELKAGLFEALAVVGESLGGLFDEFGRLYSSLTGNASAANTLTDVVKVLARVLATPIDILSFLVSILADVTEGISGFVSQAKEATGAAQFIERASNIIKGAIESLPAVFSAVKATIKEFFKDPIDTDISSTFAAEYGKAEVALKEYRKAQESVRIEQERKAAAERKALIEQEKIEGAYERLTGRISALKTSINDYRAAGKQAPAAMIAELENLEAQLARISGGGSSPNPGSIAGMQAAISKLQEKIKQTPDIEVAAELTSDLTVLENKLAEFQARIARANDPEEEVDFIAPGGVEAGVPEIIEGLDLERQAELEREKQLQQGLNEIKQRANERNAELRSEQLEREIKAIEEAEAAKAEIYRQFGNDVGEIFGDIFEGQIRDIKDFNKAAINLLLDLVERQVNLFIVQAAAREVGTKGLAGIATSAIIGAFVRGLFSAAKNFVNRNFEKGGILEGPSHEQGGIKLFGKGGYYGEAQGGEAILTRGVTSNKGALGIVSYVNEQMNGNSLGGNNLPTHIKSQLDDVMSFRPPRQIDYDRMEAAFARAAGNVRPVVSLVEIARGLETVNLLEKNADVL